MLDFKCKCGNLKYLILFELVLLFKDFIVFVKLELEVLWVFMLKYVLVFYEVVVWCVWFKYVFIEWFVLDDFWEFLGVELDKLMIYGNLN